MAYDDQTIEGLERDRWQDEEIDRRDAVGVVREKGPPALGRWPRCVSPIIVRDAERIRRHSNAKQGRYQEVDNFRANVNSHQSTMRDCQRRRGREDLSVSLAILREKITHWPQFSKVAAHL
jgi:hypothetical protein